MRIMDEQTPEVVVEHDPSGTSVDIRFGTTAGEPRLVRLTREEARRLAAMILFEAARLDLFRAGWDRPHAGSRLMSV
jgi:hypothetical protein